MPSKPTAAHRELPSVDGFCHLCQLPVLDLAEHVYENGIYHRAATKIAAVALDRWRAHMDASSVSEVPDAAENVTFCDVCTEAVPSASYIRHVTARPHLMAALDDEYFEELVKEYIDDEDLELLEDPPVVSGEETSEKSDAKTAFECHICAVQVPSPFVLQHERSFHHRTRVALSTAAARRTSAFLHNRTPKGVKLKSNIKITKLLELYTGTDFDANEGKEDVPEKVSQVDITKRLTAKQYFSDIMPFLHFTETLYTIIVDDTEYVTIRNSNGTYMRVHVASFNGVESTSAGEHYDLRCKMCDGTNKNITYSSKKGHDKLHVTSLGHIRQLLTPIDNAHGIRKLGDMLALCVVCNTLMKENGIENHIFNNMHHTAALAEALKLGEKFKEGKDDLKIIIYTAAPYFKTIYNKNNGNIFSQEDFGGAVSLPQGSLVPKPQSSLFGIPNFYPAVSKLSTGTLFGSAPASTAKVDSAAASTPKLGSVPASTAKVDSAAASTAKLGSVPASTAKLGSPASTAKVDSAAASTAKLGSVPASPAKLGSAPLSTVKVDSAAASTAKVDSVPASTAKLGSPASIAKLGSVPASIAKVGSPSSTAKVDSVPASTAKLGSPASTAKLGSVPAGTAKVDSAAASTAKLGSVPAGTAKVDSVPASTGKFDSPASTTKLGSAPASTPKIDSATATTAKVDSVPSSTAKLGSAPTSTVKLGSAPASITKVDSAPASTAKVDSAPVSTAKVDSVPASTAKLGSPASTAKVDSAAASTAKLGSAPASSAKLDSAPDSTAKRDSVPAGTAKLDSAPASTAKLDSIPASTAKLDFAPASTASLGSASKTVTNIMFLPGVTHECSMGMLIIDEKGEASFTAKDKNGEHISKIVEAGVSGHKLTKVLNQDLRELTNYLILNPNLFNDYRKLKVKEQQDILEKLISNSSCKTGQWSIITTVD